MRQFPVRPQAQLHKPQHEKKHWWGCGLGLPGQIRRCHLGHRSCGVSTSQLHSLPPFGCGRHRHQQHSSTSITSAVQIRGSALLTSLTQAASWGASKALVAASQAVALIQGSVLTIWSLVHSHSGWRGRYAWMALLLKTIFLLIMGHQQAHTSCHFTVVHDVKRSVHAAVRSTSVCK